MRTLIFTVLAISALAFACGTDKAEQQKKEEEVMALHDKVMGYDEKAIKNKTQLDSLAKLPALVAKKDSILLLSGHLAAADSAMSEWMAKFNPDYKGKSDDEVSAYLDEQKKQLTKIDTQFNNAISQSDRLLSQFSKQK